MHLLTLFCQLPSQVDDSALWNLPEPTENGLLSGRIPYLYNWIRPEITQERGSSSPNGFHHTRKRLKPAPILRRNKAGPIQVLDGTALVQR